MHKQKSRTEDSNSNITLKAVPKGGSVVTNFQNNILN